ncbi:MAG: RelA/SpoT domain-containing protein [Gammaproteobacteria bacterium]|nr:RelA/SpoT domain-containing protein [Gammaproteobacteria bacterium]
MGGLNSEAVRKTIVERVVSDLDRVGLMYRIFSRSKDRDSLRRKIEADENYGITKKIQDLIGIRVVLYFNDDIDTVRNVVSRMYEERSNDVSIDEAKNDEFRALRYNIVYSLSNDLSSVLGLKDNDNTIDTTFELQIRTIFSEGWHEVEHDLRYKCKSDWEGSDEQSRRLNGVYASLETNEWTMIKIFDELAYKHYKNNEWPAMFRQKFRLRFSDMTLDDSISEIFEDISIVKKFFRINRAELINNMIDKDFNYPVNLNNIIYFANLTKINNEQILSITPSLMLEEIG